MFTLYAKLLYFKSNNWQASELSYNNTSHFDVNDLWKKT